MSKIKRALISVSDKTDLAKFAKGLKKLGVEIVSTGGTARFLKKSGVKVILVEELTGYPKMLDGRVKSLHPTVHAGILAVRGIKGHMADLKKNNIKPIDMVVCNLYPFEEVIGKPKFTHEEAVENIDIGGPTMVRAAAKNYHDVAIVVDPVDYKEVLEGLQKGKGVLSLETKEKLAVKAFRLATRYNSAIYTYLQSKAGYPGALPPYINISLDKIQDLRYGENPHQLGAFFKELRNWGIKELGSCITQAKQLHGKELSFNNIVDLDAAWALVNYFVSPTVAIIKHTNPCGVGEARDLFSAFKKAYACDSLSAFGGIISANRPIDTKIAKEISPIFVEAIIAPGYSSGALRILKKKKNLRVMEMGRGAANKLYKGFDYKRVSGGFLVQEPDLKQLSVSDIKVATKKEPSVLETKDLFFAWGVCKHVKSNAIVIARNGATLGIGAGQMSRVDATEIAVKKAGGKVEGAVLASDAFFPFRDSVDIAAKAGIRAIIQPGGSIRDQEVIQAADEHGISMVFTGRRHFRH